VDDYNYNFILVYDSGNSENPENYIGNDQISYIKDLLRTKCLDDCSDWAIRNTFGYLNGLSRSYIVDEAVLDRYQGKLWISKEYFVSGDGIRDRALLSCAAIIKEMPFKDYFNTVTECSKSKRFCL